MENKFTPGPWTTSGFRIIGTTQVFKNYNNDIICDCLYYSDPIMGIVPQNQLDAYLIEAAANAKLIGAAPELLTALKLARMTIKELSGKEVYEQTSVGATIDAAIKKATE